MRHLANFIQLSYKRMEKSWYVARVTKRAHAGRTSFRRVQAHHAVAQMTKEALAPRFATLNPAILRHDIRETRTRLEALANATIPPGNRVPEGGHYQIPRTTWLNLVSALTDAVFEAVAEWQNRPPDAVYPLVFLDAIRAKNLHEGFVRNKALYVALSIRSNGS